MALETRASLRYNRAMRTTLNLDDHILTEVIRLTGERDRSKAVRAALDAYVLQARKRQVISLQGSLPLQAGWQEVRPFSLHPTSLADKLPSTGLLLVDTPAWVQFLGKNTTEHFGNNTNHDRLVQHIIQAIDTERARLCGVVIAELLQVFAIEYHASLDQVFMLIPTLPTDEKMMAAAGKAVQQSRQAGEELSLNQAIVETTATTCRADVIR